MANSKWISDEKMRELIERDTPMPMKRYFWQSEEYKDRKPADICPKCETLIALEKFRFCPVCGQALDRNNYEFQ